MIFLPRDDGPFNLVPRCGVMVVCGCGEPELLPPYSFAPPEFIFPFVLFVRDPSKLYLPHLPSLSPARSGSCRSKVLNANVLGVYGVFGTTLSLGNCFNSHSLSEPRSEDTGECFICMSSTSILLAARSAALGMRE